MHLRALLLAVFAITGISAADGSPDESEFDKRLISPPGCYCCTGYVVRNIAGTRCGYGEQGHNCSIPSQLIHKH